MDKEKSLYYILDENKNIVENVGLYTWSNYMSKPGSRKLFNDKIGKYNISTVFLGLDHGYGGNIILFETMIFNNKKDVAVEDWEPQYRYATYAEASIGHKHLVKIYENKVQDEEDK